MIDGRTNRVCVTADHFHSLSLTVISTPGPAALQPIGIYAFHVRLTTLINRSKANRKIYTKMPQIKIFFEAPDRVFGFVFTWLKNCEHSMANRNIRIGILYKIEGRCLSGKCSVVKRRALSLSRNAHSVRDIWRSSWTLRLDDLTLWYRIESERLIKGIMGTV